MTDDLERKSYAELRRILTNRAREFRWDHAAGAQLDLIVRSFERGARRRRFRGSDPRAVMREAIRYLRTPPRVRPE